MCKLTPVHVVLITMSMLGLFMTEPVLGEEADVLNSANFHAAINKNVGTFVQFYSPWCGHCKKIAPIWSRLAKRHNYNEDVNSVRIARVNCVENEVLCREHGVTGYPTMKLFKAGVHIGYEYSGHRDLLSFEHFIESLMSSSTN